MKVKVKAAKRKTQRDRVLEYLLDGGILTDHNGVKIGVGAVRSRVSELIRLGYPIKKGWKVLVNDTKELVDYTFLPFLSNLSFW